MRILVVGGTGGGGRAVVAAARAAGHEVAALARGRGDGPRPEIICDRMSPELSARLTAFDPAVIIDHVGYRPEEIAHLLAAKPPRARLIYISSAVVYGEGRPRPYTEADPPRPRGPFAQAKHAAEAAALAGGAISLRLGALYGPGHAPLTPWGRDAGLLERLWAGAPLPAPLIDRPVIQPLFAGDLGRLIVDLLHRPDAPSILNVVGPEALSWRGLFEAWAAEIGAPAPQIIPAAPQALEVPAHVRPFLSALLDPPQLSGALLARTFGAPTTPFAAGLKAVYHHLKT
ncbi:sugar nucleotide-binding protein [Myxococcota bacterium]|nr:sugar nucleotide-binding protein [Myxococcota bacterium]